MNKVCCTTAPYEVGAELFISDKTANVHVSRILIELSGSNRAAAATHHLGPHTRRDRLCRLARPARTPHRRVSRPGAAAPTCVTHISANHGNHDAAT